MIQYWGGACAITNISLPELLRASHAKPWKDSNDAERLNMYNGFLLSPSYDALFDSGLITFQDSGKIVFSSQIGKGNFACMNLDKYQELSWINNKHLPFLHWHRECVFRG
jgi:predicted restriction endonuclease